MKKSLHILREVYFDAVAYAEEAGYPSNLKGLCAIASYELAHRLKRNGFSAKFVVGLYRGENHCWVVTKTEILDPTVLQFSLPSAPDKPDWGAMQRPLDDHDYSAEASGLKAVRILDSDWSHTRTDLAGWKSAMKSDKVRKGVDTFLSEWKHGK